MSMAAEQTSTTTMQNTDAQLLAKFQERCRHLNEALEAERAKTSKLRRYISRLNTKSAPPTEIQHEQPGLQSLISEQAKLIEQLYSDNQALQDIAKTRSTQNQQLITANEKLKARIIELRRQVREYAERQLASPPKERAPASVTMTPAVSGAPRSWLPTSVGRLLHK
jgi:phage shock protein A